MDAVVTAGGTPAPEDVLYPYSQSKPKALIDIAGKPMIQWVLDALCEAETIDNVVIVGLADVTGIGCSKLRSNIHDQGDMLKNIQAGAAEVRRINPAAGHIAIVSSDIPAILPQHIDWVVRTAMETDSDAYYNIITRQTMESRFPGSHRSYIRLKDAEVCGGDLNVVRIALLERQEDLWNRIVESRKNALKQAALIGYDTLIMLLLRMITIDGAVRKITQRLHLSGRALLCPYAEIGMDVDKPHQLEMMRVDLARRVITG